VILLRALVTLLGALALQAGLGRIWPGVHSYIDMLLVPVALLGTRGTQRSAMLVGCASGLLQDTWFQAGTFGLNGFKRTLLGWLLGSLASWLDLNNPAGRMVVGIGLAIADNLLDLGMRLLLDLHLRMPGLLALAIQAGVTGLLCVAFGHMLDRVTGEDEKRRPV
jgi:hypothetical protein